MMRRFSLSTSKKIGERMKRVLLIALAMLSFTAASQQVTLEQTLFQPEGLQRMTIESAACTGFYRTPSFKCTPIQVPAYFAPASTGDHRALVIVSHGSGGLDRRHGDYARHLAANGINALVLGHWEARDLTKVHLDYNKARDKGGDAQNMAIDVLAATSQLKQMPEWKDTRLGYIGESMGGNAAFNVTRPYIERIVAETMNRPVHNLDAVVSLYPGCFDRSTQESFKPVPMLMVAAEKDTESPLAACQRHVEHMNTRGSMIELQVLKGEHHDFDAPYRLMYSPRAQNPAKCEMISDGKTITLVQSGKQFPYTPEGLKEQRSACYTHGLWGGSQGTKVGYSIWTEWFKKKLFN